jgi:stringent starvation protein B
MESDNKNKYDFLVQLLSEGDAMVCLDARNPEVDVPNSHKNNSSLSLVFNMKFRRPFDVQESGIFATLSFGGRPYKCVIPFEAVWAIHEPESRKGQVWEASFPKDIKLQFGASNVEVASPESKPSSTNQAKLAKQPKMQAQEKSGRSKRDRSHLRLIK